MWVCEWLLFISNCSSCPVSINSNRSHTHEHELQFKINSNHSHTHGTWTTIRDKQQSFCCLSRIVYCCLSRILVHVPCVCKWLLFISNCSSCPVSVWGHELQFEINSNHSHTHGTWTTIRDKQQSLTHSRELTTIQNKKKAPINDFKTKMISWTSKNRI
jgi:hypothetical protein